MPVRFRHSVLAAADLRLHLEQHVKDSPDALVVVGEKGATLKRGNWRRSVMWATSVEEARLPKGFRFHDLRHTRNHLAAECWSQHRELMHRMGHGSTRAALIHQHATSDRDLEIAKELSRRALAARTKPEQEAKDKAADQGDEDSGDDPDDGAAGALVPVA
jgi:integrase